MRSSSFSLALEFLRENLMALSPSVCLLKVSNTHPLSFLHLPYYRLLVKLAAAIPDAISFAFAERAAFLVRRETNSAVRTSLRSPADEHPMVFAQSLS